MDKNRRKNGNVGRGWMEADGCCPRDEVVSMGHTPGSKQSPKEALPFEGRVVLERLLWR